MPKVAQGIDTANPKCNVSVSELYTRVSDEDIIRYYFNVYHVPCLISSPLREDKNPSFNFYYDTKSKKVRFYDFARPDIKGDVLDLLQLYFNKPLNEVIGMVIDDLENIKNKQAIDNDIYFNVFGGQSEVKPRERCEISIKTRKAEQYDYDYWGQYGISKEWLVKGNVYPISHAAYNKYKNFFKLDKYAYAYKEFKDGIETHKIYRPFDKKYKWSTDSNSSVWELWSLLPPTGEKLIITSSRKDALCLWANTGIPSVSLHSESTSPKPHVMQQLKERFNKIYVLYDNDETGQMYSDKLCKQFDTIKIDIPIEFSSKDASDLYKNHGKEVLINLITKLTQ